MLIQDLWRTGCEWDEEIDEESIAKWKNWIGRLPEIEQIRVPRYHFVKGQEADYSTLQLHVFVDASSNAYGCASYFRILVAGKPYCSLVMAKSKRKYKQYVAFRIGEIHSLTNPDEWRWLPTKHNVADDVTKWQAGRRFESDSPWFQGTSFLNHFEELWPQQPQVLEEIRAINMFHDVSAMEAVIDPLRFSKWKVLIRTVACVYRFITNCRRKIAKLSIEAIPVPEKVKKLAKVKHPVVFVPLKREEHQKAESYLWRVAQAEVYKEEVKILLKNQQLSRSDRHRLEKDSELYDKSPSLDDSNVIGMEERTTNAPFIPFKLRCPIVMTKGHRITTMLVEYFHQKMGHANIQTVVNEMRQRFCIKHLRAELKRVARQCVRFRIRKTNPVIPRMAPLPVQRITPYKRPFSYTGIDYFVPVLVTVGRRTEKRWIALFTCLTTRAVHLEVAHSLTTQACVMAIRRLACRQGTPLEFFSDNGTNFKGASKEIVKRISADCEEAFTDATTRWNFNPSSAPHMSGAWERLVRSVKAALSELDDGRKLTDELLLTVLAEAEDLVNSRPLTYLPVELGMEAALTPNHFLRSSVTGDITQSVAKSNQAEALRDSYKRSQHLADLISKRWILEYLPMLNQRTKWHDESDPIEIGDVGYVVDEHNRKTWIRGVVTTVYKSTDGRIRQAAVRTTKGEFKRPVAKLAVLEVRDRKSGFKAEPTPVLRGGAM
ncbi:uncharacterized protein LOC131687937 [Topomyia yanbarensis]|uniref:uncharacterized protein LOC131687937 n=1 Tax=Topomyia yanbarensis TaxID=2498891 RepID=UPI00273C50BE|nr:uncharacterized protein LOC131687937 [Topomyia yanbarensis]